MKTIPAFFHLILKTRLTAVAVVVAVLVPDKTAQGQNLFVATGANGLITQITPGGVQSQFASGILDVHGLAFDSQGNLYANTSSSVYKFSPAGTKSTFISALPGFDFGIAFDASGNLYVGASTRNVNEYSSTGTQLGFFEYQSEVISIAFDAAGDLFTANFTSGSVDTNASSTIMERMPGQPATTFASGLDEAAGIAFNKAGDLFEADYGTGNIYEYTPGGTKSTFAAGLDEPYGLAFNSAGDLFVSDYGNGDITEIAPDGTQSVFATGLDEPTGLAIEGGPLPVPEPSSAQLLLAISAIASAFAWLGRELGRAIN